MRMSDQPAIGAVRSSGASHLRIAASIAIVAARFYVGFGTLMLAAVLILAWVLVWFGD